MHQSSSAAMNVQHFLTLNKMMPSTELFLSSLVLELTTTQHSRQTNSYYIFRSRW
uniref:Uncharacterized protein n=1 Tax=Arion vulgaris TaxID=1028688 RepID=A0A0B7AJU3_9EUPU